MQTVIPISLKRLIATRLTQVQNGKLSKQQAAELIKNQIGYSPILKDQLIEALTRNYEATTANNLQFFNLL